MVKMVQSIVELTDRVSGCLQLAILLEVSAYPKPGNVHRTADFPETKYEHFLASAVAVAPHFNKAVKRGIMVSTKKIGIEETRVGAIIRDAVHDVKKWQHGGNTLLGTVLLLSPIAVASGMMFFEKSFSVNFLRENVKKIVESTTSADAIDVYDAMSIAKPGGLGRVENLDVTDPASKKKILEDSVTLFDVFKIASEYDSIAFEWVNNFQITFDLGYPYFVSNLNKTKDINVTTINTFLKILAEVPDTLITRKVGLEKSRDVSLQAKKVLKCGGLMSEEGENQLLKFDEILRHDSHKLNPGTTADIIAAVIAIHLLGGYRP
jgi:triphosphoribosyl-dephospho-CoA synthase